MDQNSFFESPQYQDFFEDVLGYYHESEKKDEVQSLSKRIKELRQLQNLSIEQLAKMSGLNQDKLIKIENEEIDPDLTSVVKLSKALRIAAGLLLDDESGYSYSIVKKEERKKTKRLTSGKKENPEYEYLSLAKGISNRHMEPFVMTLSGENESKELSYHEGEEFVLVIEGSIRVTLGSKVEILTEGDSVYYLSSIPHNVVSTVKNQKAVILAVLYSIS